jgi:hypothetical protein
VNIATSNAMRNAILTVCALTLIGCASQPIQSGYDISNYDTLRTDCGDARAQATYLKGRIDEFHVYFRANPGQLTQPYRQYYTRLKNNLWSLRSSCAALQQ